MWISYNIFITVGGNELQHFLIEESTGEIRVNTSLDRELQERYSLNIRASDNGGKSNTATVNVKVLGMVSNNKISINIFFSHKHQNKIKKIIKIIFSTKKVKQTLI